MFLLFKNSTNKAPFEDKRILFYKLAMKLLCGTFGKKNQWQKGWGPADFNAVSWASTIKLFMIFLLCFHYIRVNIYLYLGVPNLDCTL